MKVPVFVIVLLSFSFWMGCSGGASKNAEVVFETGWYYVVDSTAANAVKKQLDQSDKFYFFDPNPGITIQHIQEAYVYSGMTNDEGVRMPLNDEGREAWYQLTKKAERKYVGFFIDNVLIIVQRIAGVDHNKAGQTIFYKKEYSQEKIEAISKKLNEDIQAAK